MPVISVIIPVYNVEPFLDRSVGSVLAQTMRDIEVILVDDGSTDGSGAVCDRLAAGDSRVRVIHQKNSGAAGARNTGLDAASGEFVSFIDSDDRIDPTMLETLYNGITENDAQIAHCNLMNIAPDGTTERVIAEMYDGVVSYPQFDLNTFKLRQFGRHLPVNVCSALFRRSIIEQTGLRFLSMDVVHAEDQLFSLCYYAQVRKGFYTPQPLYAYERRDDSLTGEKILPITLNRWIAFVRMLKAFLDAHAARQPFGTFALLTWMNVLRCSAGRDAAYVREAFALLDAQNRRFLRRCMRSLICGKSGRQYAQRVGLGGKALLYQKAMWLLILLGKYDLPIRTNLTNG